MFERFGGSVSVFEVLFECKCLRGLVGVSRINRVRNEARVVELEYKWSWRVERIKE